MLGIYQANLKLTLILTNPMDTVFQNKIFVVEDDEIFGSIIRKALEQEGNNQVTIFRTAEEFLNNLYQNPDIITIDHTLPGKNGIEVLKGVKSYNSEIPTIYFSGSIKPETVIEAYENGVSSYIIKNENAVHKLKTCVRDLTEKINLKKEIMLLRSKISDRNKYGEIVGESKAILQVLRLIQKVEKSNVNVLITGDSGTGKELVARALHFNSPRRKNPFVAVNVSAIPEDLIESELFGHEKGAFTGAISRRIGKFEEAMGGTIFLDEIGDLDINFQTKLLRVLQENKICRLGSNKEIDLNVRVIAATNKNLQEAVKSGKFREDLFFRLQGFMIHMPPLNERGNDILILARHFLKEFCRKNGLPLKNFSKEAELRMLAYPWPGNVRELKSLVERAVLLSEEDEIKPDDLIFSYDFN
ncbi:MAG: sigma-54-dependent Fis family transcriptional regulator [Chitinophagales bacterium]|nr:MAG: sigma-54-dependent Fis family transcriptional regulator [Chitinophagales bacterium]